MDTWISLTINPTKTKYMVAGENRGKPSYVDLQVLIYGDVFKVFEELVYFRKQSSNQSNRHRITHPSILAWRKNLVGELKEFSVFCSASPPARHRHKKVGTVRFGTTHNATTARVPTLEFEGDHRCCSCLCLTFSVSGPFLPATSP